MEMGYTSVFSLTFIHPSHSIYGTVGWIPSIRQGVCIRDSWTKGDNKEIKSSIKSTKSWSYGHSSGNTQRREVLFLPREFGEDSLELLAG